MTLSPTRIRGRRVLRRLVRPRALVRFVALVVVAALLGSVPVPGAQFAAWALSVLGGPPLLWAAVRATPAENVRLREALRPLRAADPLSAPRPTRRSYRGLLLGQAAGALVGAAFVVGGLVTTPAVARGRFGPDVLPGGLPNGAAWVLVPLLAAAGVVMLALEIRPWWQARGRDVDALPRGTVTVLGFGTSPPFEIHLVDGTVELPPDPADVDADAVFAAPVGRLGDVRAGDVLVRTGPLAPKLAVHLSDGVRGRWAGPLRRVARSELRPRETTKASAQRTSEVEPPAAGRS